MHQYIAHQPTQGIVHLVAVDDRRFRFISIEVLDFVENGGFPVKGRKDIIIIPVQELLTKEVIQRELSTLRGCGPQEIELLMNHQRRRRRRMTPNDLPPRGLWDPR